jgi:hypothetical protein
MIAKPSIADVARAEKVAAVKAELADLVAQGVRVAVTAEDLVVFEAMGLVIDLETGFAVDLVEEVEWAAL